MNTVASIAVGAAIGLVLFLAFYGVLSLTGRSFWRGQATYWRKSSSANWDRYTDAWDRYTDATEREDYWYEMASKANAERARAESDLAIIKRQILAKESADQFRADL